MRDVQAGRALRALRQRRGWRQSDLADAARVSQSMVSLAERGHFDRLSLATIRRLFAAVDASADLDVRWRGGLLDALLDEGHARYVESAGDLLGLAGGWLMFPEVSYSVFGERGSIDLLAFHAATGVLLVIEVKTELTSIEATMRKLDEKARLAARVARDRFGWNVRSVARLLVLAGTSTQRRRVARHASILQVAFPARGAEVRRWLRRPVGSLSGLLFLSPSDGSGNRRGGDRRQRVRRRPPRTNRRDGAAPTAPSSG